MTVINNSQANTLFKKNILNNLEAISQHNNYSFQDGRHKQESKRHKMYLANYLKYKI